MIELEIDEEMSMEEVAPPVTMETIVAMTGNSHVIPDYLEQCLNTLKNENERRRKLIDELNLDMSEMMEKKFQILRGFSVPLPTEGSQLLPMIKEVSSLSFQNLDTLRRYEHAKERLTTDYRKHTMEVLQGLQDQELPAPYDEFTRMPSYKLKKLIVQMQQDLAIARKNSVTKSQELKRKMKLYEEQHKSLQRSIATLTIVENEAIDIIEELKTEAALLDITKCTNKIKFF